jgi:hypothetical protein
MALCVLTLLAVAWAIPGFVPRVMGVFRRRPA